jgi:hypothetical protein
VVALFSFVRCRIGKLIFGGGLFCKRRTAYMLSEVFDENPKSGTLEDNCQDLRLNRAVFGIVDLGVEGIVK